MTRITAHAPTRVDLAGGTLDLWPIGQLVEDACTVNLALDLRAHCVIETGGDAWTFHARGTEPVERLVLAKRPERDVPGRVSLAAVVAAHFELPPCRIETWSEAPPGSGLGGSSSLIIALIAAAAACSDRALDEAASVALACNLETRVLGLPAGNQDHWAARCGGLSVLRQGPESIERLSAHRAMADLSAVMVVADTRVQHHSGMNNWAVFKAFLDGDEGTRAAMQEVARAASDMAACVLSDLEPAARLAAARAALDAEWNARRRLAPEVGGPDVERIIGAARAAGAAAKVCGAGGGGCVVALASSPAARPAVAEALAQAGARVLEARGTETGVTID